MDMMVLTSLAVLTLALIAVGSFELEQYRLRHHPHR